MSLTTWTEHRVARPIGRKVAALQRNLPRPIRQQIAAFPPIATNGSGPALVVLCEPRTRWDGLWAMWSWIRFLAPRVQPRLYVDGEIDPHWAEIARRLFPGITVHSLPTELSSPEFQNDHLDAFRARNRYGGKLTLLCHLQRQHDVLYADADVVAFAAPAELQGAQAESSPRYLLDQDYPSVAASVQQRAAELGLPCDGQLNSGLMYIPRGALDLSQLPRLLATWSAANDHRVAEQTLFGVLLPHAGARPLPADRYVVSNRGMFFWQPDLGFEGLIARHYVGNVRHLLYSQALPRLRRQAREMSTNAGKP